jgi:hypothetical protein
MLKAKAVSGYKHPPPPPMVLFSEAKDVREFVTLLFLKKPEMVELGLKLLELARKGELKGFANFKELGVPYPRYYVTLNKLKRLGIIVKVGSRYYISRQFENTLHNWLEQAFKIRSEAVQVEI